MKHLPLSVAGALLLAGSMAVYAQAQQPPKEPMTEEQKPAQGSGQQQPQSKEGQSERPKSGQAGKSEDKSTQDNQRGERPQKSGTAAEGTDKRPEKGGTAEGTVKQGREQDSTGAASQDGQRAQQGGDKPKSESGQKHAGKKLEAKQRTVVKETIVKRNVRPVKVNFSINVGTVIPRTVTLYDLPPTLIEYEPSYSRYKFILADDNTILVIDPETWTIVDVIEI
jgi:type IV secretory pathway VirB10-like protein